MKTLTKTILAVGVSSALALTAGTAANAMSPKKGGVMNFVVGSKIPSYDGHAETTFGMIHPIRPFYSLLIRINPDNPQSRLIAQAVEIIRQGGVVVYPTDSID